MPASTHASPKARPKHAENNLPRPAGLAACAIAAIAAPPRASHADACTPYEILPRTSPSAPISASRHASPRSVRRTCRSTSVPVAPFSPSPAGPDASRPAVSHTHDHPASAYTTKSFISHGRWTHQSPITHVARHNAAQGATEQTVRTTGREKGDRRTRNASGLRSSRAARAATNATPPRQKATTWENENRSVRMHSTPNTAASAPTFTSRRPCLAETLPIMEPDDTTVPATTRPRPTARAAVPTSIPGDRVLRLLPRRVRSERRSKPRLPGQLHSCRSRTHAGSHRRSKKICLAVSGYGTRSRMPRMNNWYWKRNSTL